MGRVNSRYNYRISKTKKVKSVPAKRISPDKIVIRNRKTDAVSRVQPSKKLTVKPIKKRAKRVNATLKKAHKNVIVNGSVTLDDIKDYCCGKRVLLVGNSKEIIKREYGSQVDSYDIVIRMNHGHPIGKYAKNMGTKYNIWAHGFLSHKKQIAEYGKIKKRIDFHIETNESKLCKRIFDKKAFLIPKKWYKTKYENNYKGKEMSTGLNIAMFFTDWVETMSEIAIVGFDFLKTNNPPLQSASARKFHDSAREEAEMIALLNRSDKYLPFAEHYNFAK